MENNKKLRIMKRLQEQYNMVKDKGYEIIGLFLYGSQNYDLDYDGSDIDSKCIILPSFRDICLNKQPVSKLFKLDNNDQIDVKDIRLMFKSFRKQNINFIEILFTDYFIINDRYKTIWDEFSQFKDRIARYDMKRAVQCMMGMSLQKLKSLTHITPTTRDTIERFGYDPKQIHHIIRLNYFIKSYKSGTPYDQCLCDINIDKEYMIDVKLGKRYLVDEAKWIAKTIDTQTREICESFVNNYNIDIDDEIDHILDDYIITMLKEYFEI